MGDKEAIPVYKKVVSVMYLSLGEAARKQVEVKYPHKRQWDLRTEDILTVRNE